MNANEKARKALEAIVRETTRCRGDQAYRDAVKFSSKEARAALAALAEAAAVPPDVAGVEPVAFIQRAAMDVLRRDKTATATVASGLLRKPFGDTVALYSADALASLAARAEALAQLNARLEDHLYEARQSAEAEATRLRGELARVRAETVEECAKVADEAGDTWSNSRDAFVCTQEAAVDAKCDEIAAAIRALEPRPAPREE